MTGEDKSVSGWTICRAILRAASFREAPEWESPWQRGQRRANNLLPLFWVFAIVAVVYIGFAADMLP
jgi:hypothetical protein